MLPLDDRLALAVSARQINPKMASVFREFTEVSNSDTSSHYAAFILPNDFDNVLLGLSRIPKDIMTDLHEKLTAVNDPAVSLVRSLEGIGHFQTLPLVQGGQSLVKAANLVVSNGGMAMNFVMEGGKSLITEMANFGTLMQGTGVLTAGSGMGMMLMLLKLVMSPSRRAGSSRPAPLYFPHYSRGR